MIPSCLSELQHQTMAHDAIHATRYTVRQFLLDYNTSFCVGRPSHSKQYKVRVPQVFSTNRSRMGRYGLYASTILRNATIHSISIKELSLYD